MERNEANAAGNQSYPALVMFKILLLQAWFNLSDEAMEFALHDRIGEDIDDIQREGSFFDNPFNIEVISTIQYAFLSEVET